MTKLGANLRHQRGKGEKKRGKRERGERVSRDLLQRLRGVLAYAPTRLNAPATPQI